jgi:hypothetical protein
MLKYIITVKIRSGNMVLFDQCQTRRQARYQSDQAVRKVGTILSRNKINMIDEAPAT